MKLYMAPLQTIMNFLLDENSVYVNILFPCSFCFANIIVFSNSNTEAVAIRKELSGLGRKSYCSKSKEEIVVKNVHRKEENTVVLLSSPRMDGHGHDLDEEWTE